LLSDNEFITYNNLAVLAYVKPEVIREKQRLGKQLTVVRTFKKVTTT